MSLTSFQKHLSGVGIVCLAALTWVLGGRGQDNKTKPGAGEGKTKEGSPSLLYLGESACAQCHNLKEPLENKDFPPLCRCTECGTWEKADKHRDAYDALLGERAQQMSKILGWKVSDDSRCLSCHAVNVRDKKSCDPSFKITEGVSCAVCHGEFENWIDEHGSAVQRKRERWRGYTPEKKETEFGMTDLWDPVKRTQKCVSCHIGNTGENKVVTHEMYAAGHPPLPGIEVATFSEQMPHHWQYIKEKKPEVQKALGFEPGTQDFERTKLVILGSVSSLRETMNLLRTQAEQAAQQREGQGLDLAQFDCYACHHDLKSPSWRQQRGFVGIPGRPQMRPWSTALVKIALQEVGKGEESKKQLDDGLNKLYRAFNAQPFGDCPAIAQAATDLVTFLDGVGTNREQSDIKVDQDTARRLLQKICSLDEVPDYDSARQLAWAFETIYSEWKPAKEDPEVMKLVQALRDELKLDLPKKADQPPGGEKDLVIKELSLSLEKINEYDPHQFQENLGKLSQLLAKENQARKE